MTLVAILFGEKKALIARNRNEASLPDKIIDVSIIIPTKNGSRTLERVLLSVFNQKTRHFYEVIVVDSGSTDNTLDLLTKYSVRLYKIHPKEFSHSRTRNYGASLSRAESYLVFLNQDAIPSDEYWLENMIESIQLEQDIKAVCATELNEKKQYFNVAGIAYHSIVNSHFKGMYIIEPYLLAKTSDMPKIEQRWLFPFTTVCAIFDKKHFAAHPFDETIEWGEDLHWAVKNSCQGYKSALTSAATVFHYHDYSKKELAAIMEHSVRLFTDILEWDKESLREFISMNNVVDNNPGTSCSVAALKNSLSWKITAPLRKLHSLLIRLSCRGQ